MLPKSVENLHDMAIFNWMLTNMHGYQKNFFRGQIHGPKDLFLGAIGPQTGFANFEPCDHLLVTV